MNDVTQPPPHMATPPPEVELVEIVRRIENRLARLETRNVRLMAHLGLDAEGNPRPGSQPHRR